MTDSNPTEKLDCAGAREAIHRLLDRDPIDPGLERRLEEHLAGCGDCRELEADHRTIQQAFARLPARALPDQALREVWARTTEASGGRSFWSWGRDWRIAAAAAVVATAILGLWLAGPPSDPAGPSDAELRQAAEQTRVVLMYTAQALRKAERVALRDVLADEVSHALRRAPIEWPDPSAARRGGSGS